MRFQAPISLITKIQISNAVKLYKKGILPLYASKEWMLAFYGQKVLCLYLAKSKRVIHEIELCLQNLEFILPLYASKQKGLAQMSTKRSKFYVDDNK
jgi:hypothetical protein